uniref:Retrotransposon gag domain-containing protein n=1 Tax=Trichuris muris TaxID=70415 RepID=A0A5S6QN28_TRIMR
MESESAVHRVAAKLPPFWADRAALWFAQIEVQFTVARITGGTKFAYVVSQLEGRYAAEVEDIITNSPARNAYSHLRNELIRRVSVSTKQRVRQVLTEEVLGERKPSQFLRHLRSLAGSTVTQDSLLRTLWLQRLPLQMQAILRTQSDTDVDRVAELADKILEVTPAPGTTAPVNAGDSAMSQLVQPVAHVFHPLAAVGIEDHNAVEVNGIPRHVRRDLQSEALSRGYPPTLIMFIDKSMRALQIVDSKMPPYDSLMETTTESFGRFDMVDDLEESEEKKNYLSFKFIVVNGVRLSPPIPRDPSRTHLR